MPGEACALKSPKNPKVKKPKTKGKKPMATFARNNIVRTVNLGSIFEDATQLIDSTVSFNQGDLLYLDTSGHLIKPIGAVAANSQTFLGVAIVTVVSGKIKSPYTTDVDASLGKSAVPGPSYGVVANLTLKTGDSINPGDLVYPSFTDDQTVTSSSVSGVSIGVYQGKALSSVASGTTIDVLLGHRYPGNTLVM